jgi:hypothetical protein
MFTTPHPYSKIQQYTEFLSEYNIHSVVHMKGIRNRLPGLLSHVYPPIDMDKAPGERE